LLFILFLILSGGKTYYLLDKHALIDMYANSNIQIMCMMNVFNSGRQKKQNQLGRHIFSIVSTNIRDRHKCNQVDAERVNRPYNTLSFTGFVSVVNEE
jgi:hypothetical protein